MYNQLSEPVDSTLLTMASAIKDQPSARLRIWLSIISLVFPPHLHSVADQPHPPSSVPTCSEELVLISPCLPFISEAPNNLSDTVPSKCCDAFSSVLDSGYGICLCYLLREPQILGFPLNGAKLLSLSSVCPIDRSTSATNDSLESYCKGNSTLPPLRSTNFHGNKQSADQAPENSSPTTSPASSTSSVESSNRSPPSFTGEKDKSHFFYYIILSACFHASIS